MWLRISECFPIEYTDIPLTKCRVKDRSYFEIHAELAKSEIFKVLEKTFQRKTDLAKNIRSKAISNIYFNSAKAYVKKLELEKVKKEILSSLRFHILLNHLY